MRLNQKTPSKLLSPVQTFNIQTFIAIFIFMLYTILMPTQIKAQKIPKGAWVSSDFDVMGNLYLTDKEKLIKWENRNDDIFEYKNSFYGEISQIDCYRGLTTLVFHKEASIIVLLDNTLSPIGSPLQLNNIGHFQIEAACLNENKQIWLADIQAHQLILIDKNMNTISQGAIFGQYTNSFGIHNMKLHNGQIVLYTTDNEILTFDRFGSYTNKFTFHSLRNPLLKNNNSYFFEYNNLLKINHITHNIDTIQTGINKNEILLSIKNQLYLFNGETLKQLNQ